MLTPEELEPLADELENVCRKLGLYQQGQPDVFVPTPEAQAMHAEHVPGAELPLYMRITYQIGDHAFSARVQEPEQEEFNEGFRQTVVGERKADVQRALEELAGFNLDDDDGDDDDGDDPVPV